MKGISYIIICFLLSLPLQSCEDIDYNRIPNYAVNISLTLGEWNIYGVSGFGSSNNFILNNNGTPLPVGFPYKYNSRTGFGGVLLIEGMDPYSSLTAVPLAYDLACPVERKANIRVQIDPDTYVAFCSECKSTYDVTMQGGAAISGPASIGKKYPLRSYSVEPNSTGGYDIRNSSYY